MGEVLGSYAFPPEVLDMSKPGEKLVVQLVRPDQLIQFPDDVYKLPSVGCRGYALILNIEQFDNEEDWASRKGTRVDVDNLSELFLQLNYRVFPENEEERYRPRKDKLDVREFLAEFIGECERASPPPASIFVFIGSHGFYPNQIVTSEVGDGTQMTLDLYKDIVNEFHQNNCPLMKDKPKIFLVQACQTFDEVGIRAGGPNLVPPIPVQAFPVVVDELNQIDSNSLTQGEISKPDPPISNALVCTAQLTGGAANRNIDKGTWFIHCFTYATMTFAWEKSLQEIFRIVEVILRRIKTPPGCEEVQLPSATSFDLKKLYFPMEPGTNQTGDMDTAYLYGIQKYCRVPANVEKWLEGNSKFCLLHTLDSKITCDKLEAHLRRCQIHRWQGFSRLISSDTVNSSTGVTNFVHVVRDCSLENLQFLQIKAVRKLRRVLLLVSADEADLRAAFQIQSSVEFGHDLMEWEDLTSYFQNRFRQRVKDKLGVEFSSASEVAEVLRGEVLADLINGSKVTLFKKMLPEQLNYYMDRTLISRNVISMEKLVEQTFPDIFVFAGMEWQELSQLVPRKATANSSTQLQSVSVNFIILDRASHFDKICKMTPEPVHWMQKRDDGRLRWIRSRGSVEVLQSCSVVNSEEENLSEDTFLDLVTGSDSNGPVIIADSPGMGKSLLLAQLGRKLSEKGGNRTVLFLQMSEFVNEIISHGEVATEAAITSALQTLTCANELGVAVLLSKFEMEGGTTEMELLLDGFDEVESNNYKIALEILKTITTSYKSARIWLTSRPHLLEELEVSLRTLGYNILPFNGTERVRFLLRFWSANEKETFLDTSRLEQFAHHCLQRFRGGDITGVPLHCEMIAEIYEEDAVEHGAGELELDNLTPFPPVSIAELYQRLVERKLEKYKPTYVATNYDEQSVLDMHVRLALELIFPDYVDKLKWKLRQCRIEEALNVGIQKAAHL